MASAIDIPDGYLKATHDIYQRRAYAAERALAAMERYSSIASAYGSPVESAKAMQWVKAWSDFAFA